MTAGWWWFGLKIACILVAWVAASGLVLLLLSNGTSDEP